MLRMSIATSVCLALALAIGQGRAETPREPGTLPPVRQFPSPIAHRDAKRMALVIGTSKYERGAVLALRSSRLADCED